MPVCKPKKSKKKLKLSREGIYPQEEALVKKWWQSELPSGDSMATETLDQRIRRRIGDLRVRETLAQLILMLEIIALEALSTHKPLTDQHSIADGTQTQSEPKKRKKKLDDINLQLDLLLDKLCIWDKAETSSCGLLYVLWLKQSVNFSAKKVNFYPRLIQELQKFCYLRWLRRLILPFRFTQKNEEIV
jgi:hypothetical protein